MPRPKLLDFVVSARCQSKHLAAILRYYRTKTDAPPTTKGKLVSTIISDFYHSLESSGDLVPFVNSTEALKYLGSQHVLTPEATRVQVVRATEDTTTPSTSAQATELFNKL